MIRPVRLEFRKMHRLRTLPILAILVIAVVALSSISLFSGSTRETFDDPTAMPWAALMLTYTLMAAMTSPILTAVLASRQTDIEHSGSGWNLAGSAGYTPGLLCRAKLAALSLVLLPAIVIQTLLVIGIGTLSGITVPLDVGAWAGYTAFLFLVNVAFLALHIWLAAVVENQLVSVGIGMLGAFLAVFSLLVPGTVGRFIPWGYYAVISHVGQHGGTVAYLTPPYAWIAGFLILVAAVFALATRRLDRLER
ncbi:ABC transporter permease [Propionibacterium freudenreichii]|uniref:ABC transporter permease n=1 Tax=Propionibacterium freudenreichii TaxID=1744 RepID=UPI00254F6D62|nr:ABC transporter permease [Propionibacterium freudenreichii]MDK9626852.1 ABC transporter permease [Propionibacterium freudenreichii]